MTLASLSTSDWQARASRVRYETRHFIDGKYVDSVKKGRFTVVNPATGAPLCEVSAGTKEDIDAAVAAAKRAFHSRVWSRKAPRDRMAVLFAFARLIEENTERFALLDTLCMGKPITDMVTIDVPAAAKNFTYFGELIDKIDGQVTATAQDAFHYILREPLGVVGCIVPWNYPLLMAAWKVAPALAAGNSVVLKPAEQSPLSGLLMAELFVEAGGPAGRVQCGQRTRRTRRRRARAAHGRGQDRVHRLDRDRQADADLCGSVEHEAREPGVRRQDAADLPRGSAGPGRGGDLRDQRHLRQHGRGLQRGLAAADRSSRSPRNSSRGSSRRARRAYRAGDPLDPATNLGPLVTASHRARVLELHRAAARARARRLEFGGNTPDLPGAYVNPTLFTRREQPHDHRAGGDLRPGGLGDRGQRHRRGAQGRQRLDLRPRGLGVDARPERRRTRPFAISKRA